MIIRVLERVLFASRWLLAPFYFALALGLLALLGKVGLRVYGLAVGFQSLNEAGVMLGVLAVVDLTLTGSLVVIVIISGYVNFVSRIDSGEHRDWPDWIEGVFGFDPDHHNGSFERELVIALCLVTVLSAALAGRTWRRVTMATT